MQDFIDFVFPEITNRHDDPGYLLKRGILTPKNDDVDVINNIILTTFSEEEVIYLSANSIADDAGAKNNEIYAVEFLDSLKVAGLPSHKLSLKVSTSIMLLRNLNPAEGLCNCTRLICRAFLRRVIDAEIITGTHAGQHVFIPRLTLTSSTLNLPFVLKRRQFPIRPAFAMTINKSQGQTMSSVGVYLSNPIFTHGQLYVACSRVTSRQALKILVGKEKDGQPTDTTITKNIVYPEVLAHIL